MYLYHCKSWRVCSTWWARILEWSNSQLNCITTVAFKWIYKHWQNVFELTVLIQCLSDTPSKTSIKSSTILKVVWEYGKHPGMYRTSSSAPQITGEQSERTDKFFVNMVGISGNCSFYSLFHNFNPYVFQLKSPICSNISIVLWFYPSIHILYPN
jgi:hypothetical protein